VQIVTSGNQLTVKAGLVDSEMTHWHLDTFLVECTPWEMREFATFRIGPDGLVELLDFLGFTFTPVAKESGVHGPSERRWFEDVRWHSPCRPVLCRGTVLSRAVIRVFRDSRRRIGGFGSGFTD